MHAIDLIKILISSESVAIVPCKFDEYSKRAIFQTVIVSRNLRNIGLEKLVFKVDKITSLLFLSRRQIYFILTQA